MGFSKKTIREGLRGAVTTLISKVEKALNSGSTQDGLSEIESVCDIVNKIGDALKYFNNDILEELEEEEDIVTEIEEADIFQWEVDRVIGKAKGCRNRDSSDRQSTQNSAITEAGQSVEDLTTDTEAVIRTSIGLCLVNEMQYDAVSSKASDLKTKPCLFCCAVHAPWNCPKVTNLKERKQIIKERRLCFNCLGTHKIANCRSDKNCKTCGKRHNTSICFTGGKSRGDRKENLTGSMINRILGKSHVETNKNEGKTPTIKTESDIQSYPKNVVLHSADNPNRHSFIYDIGISREHAGIEKCAPSIRTPNSCCCMRAIGRN